MKKVILFGILFSSISIFSQIKVTSKSDVLNQVYNGGKEKFVRDLENNLKAFSGDFQVNGPFVFTFDLDAKGSIINAKILPDVSTEFNKELTRSFRRVQNKFKKDNPAKNLAVMLDFSTNFKEQDGRERFQESGRPASGAN